MLWRGSLGSLGSLGLLGLLGSQGTAAEGCQWVCAGVRVSPVCAPEETLVLPLVWGQASMHPRSPATGFVALVIVVVVDVPAAAADR